MITITLRRIMDCKPCYDPIEKGVFEKDHDLDEPISFRWLAERIPPEDVFWCFINLPSEHDALKRHFAVDCAERVKHLMTDERSLNALVVARKHALGEASDAELRAAEASAEPVGWGTDDVATWAARTAWAASRAAAWAARAAWIASRAATLAARAITWSAAWAARAAELRWQVRRIIELTEAGEWSPVGEKE